MEVKINYYTTIFGVSLAIFAVASAFSNTLIEFLVFKLIMGFSIGGDYPAALTMLAEYAPKRARGKMMIFWIMFALGISGAYLPGTGSFLAFGLSQLQWRVLLLTGAIPALIGIFLRVKLPESPRWLARKGRYEEAIKSMKSVGITADLSQFEKQYETVPKERRSEILLSKKYLIITISMVAAIILANLGSSGRGSYLSVLLKSLNLSTVQSLGFSALDIGVGSAMGASYAFFVIEKLGRVKTIISAASLTIILDILVIFLTSYVVAELVVIFLTSTFGFPLTTGIWNFGAELFPTNVRGIGAGIASAGNRVGSISAAFLTPIFLDGYGIKGVFGAMGITALGALLIVAFVFSKYGAVEGKSLEEVEKETMESEKSVNGK